MALWCGDPGAVRRGRRRSASTDSRLRWPAVMPSCARSRSLLHASIERRAPRLVLRGPARPASASPGWAGSSRSTPTGWSTSVFWHRGRCLSYGDGVVFWALAEIVRQRLGIAEDDSPELAASQAGRGPEGIHHRPGRTRLRRTAPRPAARRPVRRRHGRGAAPRGAVRRLAGLLRAPGRASQPVVLLIENGQHADGGLLDFLDHLVDWAREVPIYVLVLHPSRAARHPTRLRHRPQPLAPSDRPPRRRRRWGGGGRSGARHARRRTGHDHGRAQGIPCSRWRPSARWSTATSSCRIEGCLPPGR